MSHVYDSFVIQLIPVTFSQHNCKIEKSEHIRQSTLTQNSLKPGWTLELPFELRPKMAL